MQQSAAKRRMWEIPVLTVAIIVVVVGVTIFHNALPMQRPPLFTMATAQGSCGGQVVRASLPTKTYVANIAMISSTEGWAVGWVDDPTGGPGKVSFGGLLWDPSLPVIAHFHHCQWSQIPVPLPHAQLFSISMGSATDGWAVGATIKHSIDYSIGTAEDLLGYDQTILLHYDGSAWHQVSLPDHPSLGRAQIQMLSPDEGWLVGDVREVQNPRPLGHANQLYHFYHGVWSRIDTTGLGPGLPVITLTATAPDECWLLTWNYDNPDDTSVMAHYQRGTWTFHHFGRQNLYLDNFVVSSPTSIWAESFDTLWHYNGQAWQSVDPPIPTGVWSGKIYSSGIGSIATVPSQPNTLWVFGGTSIANQIDASTTAYQQKFYLAVYEQGSWHISPFSITKQQSPATSETVGDFTSAAMVSPHEGWLALGYPSGWCASSCPGPSGPASSFLVHYDGIHWTIIGT